MREFSITKLYAFAVALSARHNFILFVLLCFCITYIYIYIYFLANAFQRNDCTKDLLWLTIFISSENAFRCLHGSRSFDSLSLRLALFFSAFLALRQAEGCEHELPVMGKAYVAFRF